MHLKKIFWFNFIIIVYALLVNQIDHAIGMDYMKTTWAKLLVSMDENSPHKNIKR